MKNWCNALRRWFSLSLSERECTNYNCNAVSLGKGGGGEKQSKREFRISLCSSDTCGRNATSTHEMKKQASPWSWNIIGHSVCLRSFRTNRVERACNQTSRESRTRLATRLTFLFLFFFSFSVPRTCEKISPTTNRLRSIFRSVVRLEANRSFSSDAIPEGRLTPPGERFETGFRAKRNVERRC